MMEFMVNEIFASFQGEGLHTGLPTTFIRLAGCNLRCAWCDTEYALDRDCGRSMSSGSILSRVREFGFGLVCLTGGEPLLQESSNDLITALLDAGLKVDLETNGSQDIRYCAGFGENLMISMDVKTPSSGMDKSLLESNFLHLRPIDQIKLIVKDENDLDFTVDMINRFHPSSNVIITPVSNLRSEVIARKLMEKISSGIIPSDLRFMLQMHKIIWGSDRRAV